MDEEMQSHANVSSVWPSRDAILDALDLGAILARAQADLDTEQVTVALRRLPQLGRRRFAVLLGMPELQKVNTGIGQRVVERLRRMSSAEEFAGYFENWALAFQAVVRHESDHPDTATQREWEAFLAGDEHELEVRSSGSDPVKPMHLLSHIMHEAVGFQRAILLTALLREPNFVPALVLLAATDETAAEAHTRLQGEYAHLPPIGVSLLQLVTSDHPADTEDPVDSASSATSVAVKEPTNLVTLTDRLELAKSLLRESADVVAHLQSTATVVDRSEIPDAHTTVDALIAWTDRAKTLLPNGGSVASLVAALEDEQSAEETRISELRDLDRGVSVLLAQGLEVNARRLLATEGFESRDELQVAIGGSDFPVNPTPEPEPQTEVELEATPEPEPATTPEAPDDLEPDPDPEPERTSLTELVNRGDEAVAAWIATVEDGPTARTKALRFFTAVFNVGAEHLQHRLPDLVLSDAELDTLQSDDVKLVLVGAARMALELGYSPLGQLDVLVTLAGLDGHRAQSILNEVAKLATRGFLKSSIQHENPEKSLSARWAEVAASAGATRTVLGQRTTAFAGATKVLHYLARDSEALGAALLRLEELASSAAAGEKPARAGWLEVMEMAQTLRDPATRDKLIDAADKLASSHAQRRGRIAYAAKNKLLDVFNEVCDLLEAGIALSIGTDISASSPVSADGGDLTGAIAGYQPEPPATLGDAAISRFVAWLRSDQVAASAHTSLEAVLSDALWPLYDLERDGQSVQLRNPTPDELLVLVHPPAVEDIAKGYLEAGNRQAVIDLQSSGRLTQSDSLDDAMATSKKALILRHKDRLLKADRIVTRLRSLDDDDFARQLASQIDELRVADPDRFDLVLVALARAIDDGEERLHGVRVKIQERIERLENRDDSERIEALIDSADEPLAIEFLNFSESGQALPDIDMPEQDDFTRFFPGVVDTAYETNEPDADPVARVRSYLEAKEEPTSRQLREGLRAWRVLARQKGKVNNANRATHIAEILRLLGLQPESSNWLRPIQNKKRAGWATFEVQATSVDQSFVPQLGSQAHGCYLVTLVFDKSTPRALLKTVSDATSNRPQIILYFGSLSGGQRQELRALSMTPGTDVAAVVFDHAAIGWLSTLDEPSWRRAQRITLPFATYDPYSPFARGEVPREVFVGRKIEREAVIDPYGPMFVYGGRQLGKSALLRRVEREFMPRAIAIDPNATNAAVYIDLNTEEIGGTVPPDGLWRVIARRLTEIGVIPRTSHAAATHDTVTSLIYQWLTEVPSRRLLLLLDESDNFLEADSRDSRAGSVGFPTLQRLKGLVERTEGRFKVVFAGLHQVQRFHDLPNTPVAHGGREVLVGPLTFTDAKQLVHDPLWALGYEFEDSETLWRLLLLTNYQASLIQIICQQLIRHVRRLPIPDNGQRVTITNSHVDEVYAKREVREQIIERFRWTINLDPRYRVIALVVAFLSFDAGSTGTFMPAELQEACEAFWPEGFSSSTLSTSDFNRYLAEMQGLGVLHMTRDKFGLRSPTIRSLLGTHQSIMDELGEATTSLEVDSGYDPTQYRRMLPGAPPTSQARAPLSDSDVAMLIQSSHIIVGSTALGIDRVQESLRMLAEERQLEFRTVEESELPAEVRRSNKHVVAASITSPNTDLASLVREANQRGRTMSFIVSPVLLRQLPLGLPHLLTLRRLSLQALKSWSDNPFSSPKDRRLLRRVTGGWPTLVERAIMETANGESANDALSAISAEIDSEGVAGEFLATVGVDPLVACEWAKWFAQTGPDGHTEATPATLEDLSALDFDSDHRDVVARLQLLDAVDETPDGLILDRVVLAAGSRLNS